MPAKRVWTAEEDAAVVGLGASFEQIAQRLGLARSTVRDRYYALTGIHPSLASPAQVPKVVAPKHKRDMHPLPPMHPIAWAILQAAPQLPWLGEP